jgi:hypothetical protein
VFRYRTAATRTGSIPKPIRPGTRLAPPRYPRPDILDP